MASPHPAATYWGDDLILIYNEAYTILAGQKHPHIMGQPMQEAWKEIWDDTKEYFMNAKWTGQATMKVFYSLYPPCSLYIIFIFKRFTSTNKIG